MTARIPRPLAGIFVVALAASALALTTLGGLDAATEAEITAARQEAAKEACIQARAATNGPESAKRAACRAAAVQASRNFVYTGGTSSSGSQNPPGSQADSGSSVDNGSSSATPAEIDAHRRELSRQACIQARAATNGPESAKRAACREASVAMWHSTQGMTSIPGGNDSSGGSDPAPTTTTPPTTAAPPPPPNAGGASGGSGNAYSALGIFLPGGQDTHYLAHERWMGREADYWLNFVGGSSTWNQAITNFRGVLRDARMLHADRTAVISIGLTMAQGSPGDSRAHELLAAAANGANDAHWRNIAQHIVSEGLNGRFPDGRPKLIMRLGWEHNGTWFSWSSAEGRAGLFKQAYRRAVHTVEAITGDLTWEWGSTPYTSTPNQLVAAYPGDDVVDVIGLSVYDNAAGYAPCGGDRCPERRALAWQRILTGGQSQAGLQWFAQFSRQHGKQLGIGEWGVYRSGGQNESGGGDNPGFIRNFYEFLDAQPNLLYANYFETTKPESDHRLAPPGYSFPNASREFLRLWGN